VTSSQKGGIRPGKSFFFFEINNLLHGARRQSVAVQRKGDYRPLMHIVNAPPTLTKHEAKKHRYQKKGETNYRKRKET